MKTTLIVALLFVGAAFVAADASEEKVTPVQKVIQLLQGMLEKGKKERHEEQLQFAAYKQFCDETKTETERAIAEANEMIEKLKADIQKYTADAEQLAKEIAEHEADIGVWTADIKAATKVRDIEKADYDATHKDYSESIDALRRAIAVLKEQAFDRKQASLLQLSALKLMPEEAKRTIDAFLAQDPDAGVEEAAAPEAKDEGLEVAAPEANAYEFQSHGIIEMLEKLLDKFVDELTTLEKEEMNAQHEFEMLVQDLTAEIGDATKDRDEKAAIRAKKLEAKAAAEAELAETILTRDADQKYLDDLTATCAKKATDFESRQQLRAEEIEAIEKAIEIISGEAVTGNAEKHLPTLVQTSAASLSQLRADGRSPTQGRASQYLQEQAKALNSRVLAALAVRAADSPFKKVIKMIKDLIVRLQEEASEEAEHKGWCDEQLSTNEQVRKKKTAAVETLHAEVDELKAAIAMLAEQIAELTKAVAELDAAMAKATEMRQAEKAKNEETIKDSQDAQAAVAQAVVVLKEFYAKAAEATAFLQKQEPRAEPPAIFDSPYKGMQAENGGVVGMLEVIESDFARLEAETKAAEETAQREYDAFMADAEADKAAKVKDIEKKTAEKQDKEQALTSTTEDLEGTQKELDAALAYFDKLKPSCVEVGVSFDDRVARRKEEIASLQEALKILQGEDIA